MNNGRRAFPVFDADSHVYEPAAIWQEYLDPEYRVLARSAFWHEDDETESLTIVNGRLIPPASKSRILRDACWRPGMTPDDIGALPASVPAPPVPGARDAHERLRDMDAMGVDQALVFPTLFLEFLPEVENPDVAWALARAYNDWISDYCKAAPGRLFPVAVLPMQSVSFAVKEVGRLASQGFKAVAIRPAFYARPANHPTYSTDNLLRSLQPYYLNHPYYDPLWKELEGHGIVAALHPATGSSNAEWFSHGPFIERVSREFGMGHPAARTIAPAMDNQLALLAMLAYAHFDRYPALRVVFAHSKASWLPLVLEKSEGRLTMAARAAIPVRPQSFQVFAERGVMIGFDANEFMVQRLYEQFEDKGVWGSRYPMQETATAHAAIDQLTQAGVPATAVEKMMGQNAAKIYGVQIKAIGAVGAG